MEYTHVTDTISILQAMAAGIAMGAFYDCFRFLRRLNRYDNFSVALQDMAFWISSAICLFFVCIRLNNGFIRIYFIIFAFVGWLLYFAVAGRLFFAFLDRILSAVRQMIQQMKIILSTKIDKN